MQIFIHKLLYFLSGVILTNGTPHLINGLSGRYWPKKSKLISNAEKSYQQKKISCSPIVNFIWGFFNVIIALFIILGVGDFAFDLSIDFYCLLFGVLIGGIYISWNFSE